MLKTGVRKYDIFKMYYWHGAMLVGKYRLPQLQARKHPSHLIVCGRKIFELEKYDNVIYYPCFSQRWKERVAHGK